MRWYAVHTVMRVQFKDAVPGDIPVWENVILVHAESGNNAAIAARSIAKGEEGDSRGSFTWDGRPARWVFAGIRKVITCDAPSNGVEVTWSQFRLKSEEDLEALVDGKEVVLTYEDEGEPRGR